MSAIPTPALVELAKEWRRLWDAGNEMAGDLHDVQIEAQTELVKEIKSFPSRSIADLAVKAELYEVEYPGLATDLCADIIRLAKGGRA